MFIRRTRRFEARAQRKSNAVLNLILKKFNEFYDELYNSDNERETEGYYEMLELSDDIFKNCKPLVSALAEAQHDYFTSDRDCVALAKTLLYYGLYKK